MITAPARDVSVDWNVCEPKKTLLTYRTCAALENAAPTARSPDMVRMHVLLVPKPEHEPVQPRKTELAEGAAVSVTVVPSGKLLSCVEQVGPPEEVYFRPASTLVAQLFGDPEVNLLEATLRSKGGSQLEAQVLGEQAALAISADAARALQKKSKNRVRLGFRPADVQDTGADDTRDQVHRRAAHERCDKRVGRAVVDVVGGAALMHFAA